MSLPKFHATCEVPYQLRVNDTLFLATSRVIIHAANNHAQRIGHAGWAIIERPWK